MKTAASITIQYDNPFSPFSASDWKQGFQWAKAGGLDGVELILSDPKLLDVNEILEELQKNSLSVATIATGQATALEGFSLTSPKEWERELAYRRCCEDIDFSLALGTKPNVTIGLIRGRGVAGNSKNERAHLLRELSRVTDYAEAHGVSLNLEPINRYEVCLLNSVEDTAAFLDELGNPKNVGILYDTFHVNIEDGPQAETIKKFAKKIIHVHFADSNRRLPGEGHINFPEIRSSLISIGYEGWVSLEMLSIPSRAHVQSNMASSMAAIFNK
ncbi:MAG: sugar phosphate isomerase/epimerase family protein [Oscillospiraceae bacterium]